MPKELHLLILEDVASDAELMEQELRKAKIECSTKRVQTEDAFREELKLKLDLILADYSLPLFEGISALSIAREKCPDVPFIFVSGAIGEELAIEALKRGATDYVLKSRLSRLAPSVQRALREVKERTAHKRGQETLREAYQELQSSEERQRTLRDIARAVSAHLDREELFHAIAGTIEPVVPLDRLAIILPRPEDNTLLLYAIETPKGNTDLGPGVTFPPAGSVPGWVLEHKRPFIISSREDLKPFPVSLKAVRGEGLESGCNLPLLVQGQPVGALILSSKERAGYKKADLPFLEEIAEVVALALDNCLAYEEIKQLKDQLTQENIYLQEEIKTDQNFEEIVGKSRELKKVLQRVEIVAPTDSSVLITGETGTGKDIFARSIHNLSPRKNKPLIKVNCAALPAGLIESELFGHEKGAFTGAISKRMGRFELAHRGSIFLDEMGDLPKEVQVKLLRVLQDQEFERVGGTATIKVDVRVIVATNRDLTRAIADGRFREDLYYRLNVFPIPLPSLEERKKDIPLLVQYFVNRYATRMGKPIEKISQDTMRQLTAYRWPGNVRELENVIERAVILSKGSLLEIEDDFSFLSPALPDSKEKKILSLEEVESRHIINILDKTGWVIEGPKGAAQILSLHPNTLRGRMKKLGIKRAQLELP